MQFLSRSCSAAFSALDASLESNAIRPSQSALPILKFRPDQAPAHQDLPHLTIFLVCERCVQTHRPAVSRIGSGKQPTPAQLAAAATPGCPSPEVPVKNQLPMPALPTPTPDHQ